MPTSPPTTAISTASQRIAETPPEAYLYFGTGSLLSLSNAASINWSLQPGTAPYSTELTVSRVRAEDFMQFASRGGFEDEPYALSLVFMGRTFQHLRMLTPAQHDPWYVRLRIADRRSDWQYIRLYLRANIVRRGNDRYELSGGGGAAFDSPDDIRSFATYRYLDWTLDNGTPYSAKSLAIELLRRLHARLDQEDLLDEDSFDDCPDNGVPVDAQTFQGATVEQSIRYLLDRANLEITIDDDGMCRMFDPWAELPELAGVIKGGALRIPSNARSRAQAVRWCAPQLKERRFTVQTSGSVAVSDEAEPELFNVARLSRPITLDATQAAAFDLSGERTIAAGTWVPIGQILTYFGMPESELRQFFAFPEFLKARYAKQGALSASSQIYNPTRLSLLNDLLSNYRTTWRISPRFMDQQMSVQPYLVDVMDPTDRAAVPSPVYTYWFESQADVSWEAGLIGTAEQFLNDSSWAESASNPTPAPFSVQMLDPELGVFQIVPNTPQTPDVVARFPGNVLHSPATTAAQAAIASLGGNIGGFLTELSSTFRLEVVLSCEAGYPNDRSSLYQYTVTTSEFGIEYTGRVSFMDAYYSGEPARINEAGTLVNEKLLQGILRSETLSMMGAQRDRPVGILTVVNDARDGLEGTPWVVVGHMREVRFTLRRDGGEDILLDFGMPAKPQSAMEFMPPQAAAYLQRQIIRGFRDGRREVFG